MDEVTRRHMLHQADRIPTRAGRSPGTWRPANSQDRVLALITPLGTGFSSIIRAPEGCGSPLPVDPAIARTLCYGSMEEAIRTNSLRLSSPTRAKCNPDPTHASSV